MSEHELDDLADIYEAFATATPWRRNPNPLSMSAAVSAKLPRAPAYDVALTVNLPQTYLAWTDPKTFRRTNCLNFDLASEADNAAFQAAACRSNSELKLIFDRCNREWRGPTPSEERRVAELKRDFDVAEAALEMTLLPGSH